MKISRRSCLLTLLAVIVSVTSEKCNTALDGQLVVGEKGTIWRLNPQDNSREAYISADYPMRFSYSYNRNTLYYSDLKTRQVYALQDNSSKAHVLIARQNKKWLAAGICVDNVNDKLYFTEYSAGGLHVYDLNSGNSTVVIGTNLTNPSVVEIDPNEGYLFVLDEYQILKAELDGSNPTPIYELKQLHSQVDRRPIGIADLTLDVKSKRIYWMNRLSRTVASSDYNGENKRIHFEGTSAEDFRNFIPLALWNGSIYQAAEATGKLFKIDGDKSEVILLKVKVSAIAAVDCERKPKTDNPCANSQCQQFCLLSKSSQNGYRCACNVGFELTNDGKTCGPIRDFILFNELSHLRGLSLSGSQQDAIQPYRFRVGHASVFDFDANNGIVYLTGIYKRNDVFEIRLNGTEVKSLTPDFLSTNVVGNLAYDWATKNLYYFTSYYSDLKTLSVMNVDDPTYSKILIRNISHYSLDGIVVHPNKGYVFFAKSDDKRQQTNASISRMATDGSGLKVIVDIAAVDSIDAFAVDLEMDRIYWTAATTSGEHVTRHANLDGQDVRKLDLPTDCLPTSLVIHGNYIYGISNNEQFFRADKNGKNPVNFIYGHRKGGLSDVKVFSRSLQITQPDHPCKSHNCQKFCFAVPTEENRLKATCGCPYGEKLADNGFSCVDNSKEEPAFLACEKSWYEKCDFQTA